MVLWQGVVHYQYANYAPYRLERLQVGFQIKGALKAGPLDHLPIHRRPRFHCLLGITICSKDPNCKSLPIVSFVSTRPSKIGLEKWCSPYDHGLGPFVMNHC